MTTTHLPHLQNLRWIAKLFLIISFFDLLFGNILAASDTTTSLCSESDRASLLSFKAGIWKDTTDILSSWTGGDCCGGGWEGVECNPATGRVVALHLQRPDRDSAVYLKGTLSASLGNLQFLEVMVISGMKHIAGPIPASFSRLTRLHQLVLEDNALGGEIPGSLGQLPLLNTLSLSGNRLKGQIPPGIGNLKNLLQLNLAKNSLEGPFPATFENLHSLQYVDISFNLLSGPIPNFVGKYQNLTFMDLSNNQLSGQVPDSLCSLAKLMDISLSHNQLTGRIPDQVGSLKSLTTLSVAANGLTGPIPVSISRLQNLWYLNLSRNGFSDPLPGALAKGQGIPKVISIDLSYNNLSLGTVPEWMGSRGLTDIHLAGCNLGGALPKFKKPDSLTSIDLSDNRFTNGLSSNFFINMSSLQRVKLSNNQLTADISGIAWPEGLSSIDLHSNRLSGYLSKVLTNERSSLVLGCFQQSNFGNPSRIGPRVDKLEMSQRGEQQDYRAHPRLNLKPDTPGEAGCIKEPAEREYSYGRGAVGGAAVARRVGEQSDGEDTGECAGDCESAACQLQGEQAVWPNPARQTFQHLPCGRLCA